jgi:Oxidoreductase family, C-terminal alpha/beta domain
VVGGPRRAHPFLPGCTGICGLARRQRGPYAPGYHPKEWRRWWDFGGGTLGDMGCHYIDLPFWALKLRAPTSIEAEGPPVHPETTPAWLIVRYQFAARGPLPAVQLTWYNGGKMPELINEEMVPKWGSGRTLGVPLPTATEPECAQPSPPVNQPEGHERDVAALRLP